MCLWKYLVLLPVKVTSCLHNVKQGPELINALSACNRPVPLIAHLFARMQHIYECLGSYTKDEARIKEFKDRRINEIVDAGLGAAADDLTE